MTVDDNILTGRPGQIGLRLYLEHVRRLGSKRDIRLGQRFAPPQLRHTIPGAITLTILIKQERRILCCVPPPGLCRRLLAIDDERHMICKPMH